MIINEIRQSQKRNGDQKTFEFVLMSFYECGIKNKVDWSNERNDDGYPYSSDSIFMNYQFHNSSFGGLPHRWVYKYES